MRVLLAGLFVCGGLAASIAGLSYLWPHDPPPCVIALVMVLVLGGLVVSALVFFNRKGALRSQEADPAVFARELEMKGLLATETYRATRAFQVEEFEDEGSTHFIELEAGGVLVLTGQYLYDYEPLEKRGEVVRPRRFPCSEFVIRRDRTDGCVVDILCRGGVIDPEGVAPPFAPEELDLDTAPYDGKLIRDRSYDELRLLRRARP